VYLHDRLDPVLNYSSGVLAVSANGQQQAHVTLVDRSELADVRRGPTIGIDGIPDSLPARSSLLTSPWTVCSRQAVAKPTQLRASVSMLVGESVPGRGVDAAQSIVVRSAADARRYLLWQGQRLRIGSDAVATLLNIQSTDPLVVGTAFLNALPPGAELRTPALDGLGGPGPSIAGRRVVVGQLVVATDTQQSFVVLADGLEPITPVEARLVASLTSSGRVAATVQSTEAQVIGVAQVKSTQLERQFAGLPAALPRPTNDALRNGGVCAVYAGTLTDASLRIPPSRLPPYQADDVVESATSRRGLADVVSVRPGHAAVARSTDGSPTAFLIAAPGRKYAFSSAGLLTAFGYADVTPTRLPGQLADLIPTGPALDATAALRPVSR
jgi:type VII secretion protein EccB